VHHDNRQLLAVTENCQNETHGCNTGEIAMIRFLIKGLMRDRHRSFFPVLTVTMGVMITILAHCWITGIMGDFIDFNARYNTGHVKIVTRAYAENMDQAPNDLALLHINTLIDSLQKTHPEMDWVPRIKFGGILDAPDEFGETRAQGTAIGFGIDLLSGNPAEILRFSIPEGLVSGEIPDQSLEILISDQLARRLEVIPGDTLTLLTTTMYGAMVMQNFRISGTVTFGVKVIDRGAMIADIKELQRILDMENAAGEILGFNKKNVYNQAVTDRLADDFNQTWKDSDDEFAPVMLPLSRQNDLSDMLDYMRSMISIMISVFIVAMSVVLWNSGLIGGLRRYGEIGVRLAIGENKGHIYRAMILESVIIGVFGSAVGTVIGLSLALYLQVHGFNIGNMMENATMMMPNVLRASITPPAYFIGLIPGLFATVLGTSLSGIGIYRRQTASLFKELEA
jgi:putative ABC transport system permease protein